MANNAAYDIKFVSKSRETLERLVRIMRYEDPEYFIYRVFSVEDEPIVDEGNGYFSLTVYGDVAWSIHSWFDHIEVLNEKAENGAHYVSLDILAKRLDFGVEAFCEECGCEFQEWHRCDHNGNTQEKCVEWREIWQDEDGNELDEPIHEGGLPDYGEFSEPAVIYDQDALVKA